MSVFSDKEFITGGNGLIRPFRHNRVQPASYDLTLADKFLSIRDGLDGSDELDFFIDPLDRKQMENLYKMHVTTEYAIDPGEFVLAHTKETLKVPLDCVACIDGKSSLGRLGLAVHITAGYIDPGFEGRVTLELYNFNKYAILLQTGMPIAQIRFHMLMSESKGYDGKYQGDEDVQGSRYYLNE